MVTRSEIKWSKLALELCWVCDLYLSDLDPIGDPSFSYLKTLKEEKKNDVQHIFD